MNVLRTVLSSSFILMSLPCLSTEMKLDQGITLEVLNEHQVNSNKDHTFIEGKNQLVLTFSGRLKDGGKPEPFSSKPYVVEISLNSENTYTISLISDKYQVVEKKQSEKKPIFTIKKNGAEVKDVQQYLLKPKEGTFMPYADILGLVSMNNRENGLLFDSGKLIDLKNELKKLDSSNQSSHFESEVSLQLKIWFSKASNEQKREFLQWVAEDAYSNK